MTKKQRILLGSTVIMSATLITYWVLASNTQLKTTDKSLWTLVNEMDDLRDLKQECADNLWIKDSAHFLRWESGYCDSWDNEIIELRNQINQLQKKDYEGLM